MFSLDGILGAFLSFFQDFFLDGIFSFLTDLLGNVLPSAA